MVEIHLKIQAADLEALNKSISDPQSYKGVSDTLSSYPEWLGGGWIVGGYTGATTNSGF